MIVVSIRDGQAAFAFAFAMSRLETAPVVANLPEK